MFKQVLEEDGSIKLHKLLNPSVKNNIIKKLHAELNNKSYKDYHQIGITQKMGIGSEMVISTDTNEFISKSMLGQLYDARVSELLDGTFGKKYSAEYTGYVYKTDIFAAGITFARIRYYLQISNPKLLDLIANMVRIDPDKRFNINQCLAHPLFK
jgi:serine/threonine protein kinase